MRLQVQRILFPPWPWGSYANRFPTRVGAHKANQSAKAQHKVRHVLWMGHEESRAKNKIQSSNKHVDMIIIKSAAQA